MRRTFRYEGFHACRITCGRWARGREGAGGSALTHIGTWLIIKLSFSALFLYAFASATIPDICIIRNIAFCIFAAGTATGREDRESRVRGNGYARARAHAIIACNLYHHQHESRINLAIITFKDAFFLFQPLLTLQI